MIDKKRFPKELFVLLENNLYGRKDEVDVPPPVFDAMKGELIDYNIEQGILINRFPVLTEQLNPYGNMQGGIIAAAIDNTIGPLSMLVAAPNFTRHIEVKYSKVVSAELDYIYVTAKFIQKKKRQLFFQAIVNNEQEEKMASAKSIHWLIE
ncbi:MAG: PaaI family thioesterase [gamma proteobacterium symbiont of Lucinoma myriamae]|nr:PaaI family thioesterase [gamma proteobacterium symbiont of Lucinoma myriamae]MCU7819869.1 PaaI family thioesterase [gamma proteobacterium symbiont of Lucinoma myriamae]MCU7833004.1 PaaI family thioesterase [gamma proteobacterium symbiont of Lucinoma myriamae]